jgi:hypothetical protein
MTKLPDNDVQNDLPQAENPDAAPAAPRVLPLQSPPEAMPAVAPEYDVGNGVTPP